jgi:hypothetical protein
LRNVSTTRLRPARSATTVEEAHRIAHTRSPGPPARALPSVCRRPPSGPSRVSPSAPGPCSSGNALRPFISLPRARLRARQQL